MNGAVDVWRADIKRHLPTGETTSYPAKKRRPYTAWACSTCRKRKGKCDGAAPCSFCKENDFSCVYTDKPAHSALSAEFASEHPEHQASRHISVDGERIEPCRQAAGTDEETAATLRTQYEGMTRGLPMLQASADLPPATAKPLPQLEGWEPGIAISKNYGPMNPEYSMEYAQSKLLASSNDPYVPESPRRGFPSEYFGMQPQVNTVGWTSNLTAFLRLLKPDESVEALHVYQEVIGALHPVVSFDSLREEVGRWYTETNAIAIWTKMWTYRLLSDHILNLILLNLCLTIGLFAEGSDAAQQLFDNYKPVVDVVLMTVPATVDQAKIAFLLAVNAFYQDQPRYAWRVNGLATRLLFESGCHDATLDHPTGTLENTVTLICSVVIFDRQLSASTGLPPDRLQQTRFEHALHLSECTVESSYLRAMVSLVKICDQFEAPMALVAQGQFCYDELTYEVMDFQVQQWRRRAISAYEVTSSWAWRPDLESRPPAGAVVIYLRANGLRKLLLRPFFLSNVPTSVGKRYVQTTVDLMLETSSILYHLDQNTELYRRQHPFFQHILTSCCASLFLVVSFVKEHGSSDVSNLTSANVESIFLTAWELADRYKQTSALSVQLQRRLRFMQEPLIALGLMSRSIEGSDTARAGVLDASALGTSDPIAEADASTFGLSESLADLSDLSWLFE